MVEQFGFFIHGTERHELRTSTRLGVLWRGVFVETSKADFNTLFEALVEER
jgi:hypothetical protein